MGFGVEEVERKVRPGLSGDSGFGRLPTSSPAHYKRFAFA